MLKCMQLHSKIATGWPRLLRNPQRAAWPWLFVTGCLDTGRLVTGCPDGTVEESVGCAATVRAAADAGLAPVSSCPPGSYVARAATVASDAVCQNCPPGTFSDVPDAASCRPWQACAPGSVPSIAPEDEPNAERDRLCLACGLEAYAEAGQCIAASVCTERQFETVPLTPTEDRECGPCRSESFVSGRRVCAPLGTLVNFETGEHVSLIGEDLVTLRGPPVGEGAQWTFEELGPYYRIRNWAARDRYLHVEYGQLEAGPILKGWASAWWQLEEATDQFPGAGPLHRLRNVYRGELLNPPDARGPSQALHVERGELEVSEFDETWRSAAWQLPEL